MVGDSPSCHVSHCIAVYTRCRAAPGAAPGTGCRLGGAGLCGVCALYLGVKGDVHLLDAIHWPIGPKKVMSTSTLRDYHQSNFLLLRGEFKYIKPAGREYSSGHRTSPKARVNAKSIQSDHGYFGAHCRVDKTARLGGDVVIGDRVVVGKGANVRDSIIFDRTFIGSNTDCSDAIIDGNLLIKVDSGVSLLLDDPVLFGAIA